jgi:hypothetical protein
MLLTQRPRADEARGGHPNLFIKTRFFNLVFEYSGTLGTQAGPGWTRHSPLQHAPRQANRLSLLGKTRFGVSVLRALWTSACPRRSIRPMCARLPRATGCFVKGFDRDNKTAGTVLGLSHPLPGAFPLVTFPFFRHSPFHSSNPEHRCSGMRVRMRILSRHNPYPVCIRGKWQNNQDCAGFAWHDSGFLTGICLNMIEN